MCVIFFAHKVHPNHPLIALANRDEFYDRPTAVAGRWPDHPQIFAGRDLLAGGTWIGVTDSGRFAAVTNYREPDAPRGRLSRGDLVADFLKGNESPSEYIEQIKTKTGEFSGFNVLAGIEGDELYYFSNRGATTKLLQPGIYGLSNHALNTAWPKVTRGLGVFESLVSSETISKKDCFALLTDETIAADEDLPDTGVGINRERQLSPIFIRTPNYGTRSSTVVLFDRDGRFDFEEKVFV
jgi:uncharacterized protein with NRDE domain